jgi:hypothetical protein
MNGITGAGVLDALGGADTINNMAHNEGICGAGIGGYMLYGNGVDDRLDGGGGNDTIKDENGTDMCNGGHDINYMRSTCEAVTRAPRQALPVPPPGHSRTAMRMK